MPPPLLLLQRWLRWLTLDRASFSLVPAPPAAYACTRFDSRSAQTSTTARSTRDRVEVLVRSPAGSGDSPQCRDHSPQCRDHSLQCREHSLQCREHSSPPKILSERVYMRPWAWPGRRPGAQAAREGSIGLKRSGAARQRAHPHAGRSGPAGGGGNSAPCVA